ncbi:MAG: histone deacetylase [Alphaproteobacteria bacterium]
MNAPLPLVYASAYQASIPGDHRFPMGKYGAVHALISQRPWFAQAVLHQAIPATVQQASLAHDSDYVQRVAQGELTPGEVRVIGLPQNPTVRERSFASAGGSLLACRLALQTGWAGSLAGGSHHAGPRGGRGFCVMNDVGIALSWLLADETLSRALVLDLDVHQGDGTAEIFADEPRVETVSLHCEDNFPFRKVRSDVDFGLPARTGDSGYLQALDGLLTDITVRARACDLIVLNAGVDPHADDRLGRLALSEDGLAQRDLMVFDWARDLAKPLCVVMGGGYDHRIDVIAERHARVYDRLFQAASRG